jgi:hypothetical protein
LQLDGALPSVKTALSSSEGSQLTGVGLLLLLQTASLTSLGTFEALFLDVSKSSESCHSVGDETGSVLMHGTFHIVYTALSPLGIGILYLLSPLTMKCGGVELKVKGSMLSSIVATGEGELTSMLGVLKGNGKGKPSLTTYYNSEGTAVKAKLEANFGIGFVETSEEAEESIPVCAADTKMFDITGQ